MLNENEIFYLNKALKDKEIFGFSYKDSVSKLLTSGKNSDDIKNDLISKGYLEEDGQLNEISFQVIRNLDIYKKANKYIQINKIIGAMDSSRLIPFFQEVENKEYEFKKIHKEALLLSIVNEYKFLKGYREVDEFEAELELEEITRILGEKDLDESIYIKKTNKNVVEEYNVYFYEGKRSYKYNVLKKKLSEKNPRSILLELVNTLEIERGVD